MAMMMMVYSFEYKTLSIAGYRFASANSSCLHIHMIHVDHVSVYHLVYRYRATQRTVFHFPKNTFQTFRITVECSIDLKDDQFPALLYSPLWLLMSTTAVAFSFFLSGGIY